jgi:hypothetical protein
MEIYRAGREIGPEHEAPAHFAEDRRRDPAEVDEHRGDALAPIVLAVIEKRLDEESVGITEHSDQPEEAHRGPGDDAALLPEIGFVREPPTRTVATSVAHCACRTGATARCAVPTPMTHPCSRSSKAPRKHSARRRPQ